MHSAATTALHLRFLLPYSPFLSKATARANSRPSSPSPLLCSPWCDARPTLLRVNRSALPWEGAEGRDWSGWRKCCQGGCEFCFDTATALSRHRVPEKHWLLCSRSWQQFLVKLAENKVPVWKKMHSYMSAASHPEAFCIRPGQRVTPVGRYRGGFSSLASFSYRTIEM